jgi:hypothetical protein
MKHILKATLFTLILLIVAMTTVQASSVQTEYEYYFGMYTLNENTIEKYGTLPTLETDEQIEHWHTKLEMFSNAVKYDLAAQYMYPNGEVFTCGSNSDGYFVVLFRNDTVEKQHMDEIYSFLENAAEDMGIQSIPVEFGYGLYIPNLSDITEEYMKSGESVRTEYRVYDQSDILVAYGTIPEFKNFEEWSDWYAELGVISNEVAKAIFEGNEISQTDAVTGMGPIVPGEIEIGIYRNLDHEEKIQITSEIYEICEREANKRNITSVPVSFYDADYEVEDSTVPGFTALSLLLVFSVMWLKRD